MIKLYILVLFFILIPLTYAETTFFDNSNNAFIMKSSSSKSQTSVGTQSKGTTNPSLSYTKSCQRELEIVAPSKISTNQGETTQISVLIKNNGTCYLKNINVSLDVPFDWKTQSSIINELYVKKNQTINLEITPPIKATGNHSIKINTRAERTNKTKEVQVSIISKENNKVTSQVTKNNQIIAKDVILNNEDKDKTKDRKIKYIIISLIILITTIITYFFTNYFKNKYHSTKTSK